MHRMDRLSTPLLLLVIYPMCLLTNLILTNLILTNLILTNLILTNLILTNLILTNLILTAVLWSLRGHETRHALPSCLVFDD